MAILKAKPKAAPRSRWRDRARTSMLERPLRWWLGAMAAFGVAMFPMGQVVWPWLMAQEAKYQRADAAKTDVDKLRSEATEHNKVDRLNDARERVGQADIKEFMLRRTLIDCAGKIEQRRIARTEAEACKDWEVEHIKALDRLKSARERVQELTK